MVVVVVVVVVVVAVVIVMVCHHRHGDDHRYGDHAGDPPDLADPGSMRRLTHNKGEGYLAEPCFDRATESFAPKRNNSAVLIALTR